MGFHCFCNYVKVGLPLQLIIGIVMILGLSSQNVWEIGTK